MAGTYFRRAVRRCDAPHRPPVAWQTGRVSCLQQRHRRPGAFGDLQVHFGPGHIVEDMYAMAEADLLIGPPSTYTGWASFYGKVPLVVMESADDSVEIPPSVSGQSDRVGQRVA